MKALLVALAVSAGGCIPHEDPFVGPTECPAPSQDYVLDWTYCRAYSREFMVNAQGFPLSHGPRGEWIYRWERIDGVTTGFWCAPGPVYNRADHCWVPPRPWVKRPW